MRRSTAALVASALVLSAALDVEADGTVLGQVVFRLDDDGYDTPLSGAFPRCPVHGRP